MKKIISMLLIFSVIFALTGCSSEEAGESNQKIRVVTTSYVLSDFSKELYGANIKATVLLNPGENPREHEITKRDMNFINHADVFICNGNRIDTWVDDFIGSDDFTNDNLILIDASEGIEIKNHTFLDRTMDSYYVPSKNEAKNAEETSQPEKDLEDIYEKDANGDILLDENFNPVLKETEQGIDIKTSENNETKERTSIDYCNIWMSPDNAVKMVENIYNGMYDLENIDIEILTKNFIDYTEVIRSIKERMLQLVDSCNYKFVVVAENMGCYYLLDFLGLEYLTVNEQEYGGSKDESRKEKISNFLKKNTKIKNILSEGSNEKNGLGNDIKVFEINSLSKIQKSDYNSKKYTYYEIMQQNYDSLKNVLF